MANFFNLPNEIKLQIIETSDPEDVENLALCCKLVYSLAGKILRQHKVDKDNWSNLSFSFGCYRKDEECLEAFYKLREIAKNRRLRRYPKHVTIKGRVEFPFSPDDQLDKQDDIIQACDKIFQDLQSPYINGDEMKAWYKRLIDTGVTAESIDTTPATANSLLLTLLPNVERISILWLAELSVEMANIIRTISIVNRDAPSFIENRLSLTKLSELDLRSHNLGDDAPEATGILEAFMTLPSLQILRLGALDRHYKIDTFLHSTPHSNIREIHCLHCALSATQLACLLDRVECLRVFSYDQHAAYFGGPVSKEIGPAALLSVVFQHAKTSLTYLNYDTKAKTRTPKVEHGDVTHVDKLGPAGSFRGYEALKTLRLSRAILLEDVEKEDSKKLVDKLPTSLEELELVGVISPEEAQVLFEGLLEMKRERLPNLKYVVFDRQIPFDEEIVMAYERAGLILDWRITNHKDIRDGRFYKTDGLWLGGIERMRD